MVMLKNLIDGSICKKLLNILLQIKTILNKNETLISISLLNNICEIPEGIQCVIENEFILEYIQNIFDDEEIADQAVNIIISIFKSYFYI